MVVVTVVRWGVWMGALMAENWEHATVEMRVLRMVDCLVARWVVVKVEMKVV